MWQSRADKPIIDWPKFKILNFEFPAQAAPLVAGFGRLCLRGAATWVDAWAHPSLRSRRSADQQSRSGARAGGNVTSPYADRDKEYPFILQRYFFIPNGFTVRSVCRLQTVSHQEEVWVPILQAKAEKTLRTCSIISTSLIISRHESAAMPEHA